MPVFVLVFAHDSLTQRRFPCHLCLLFDAGIFVISIMKID